MNKTWAKTSSLSESLSVLREQSCVRPNSEIYWAFLGARLGAPGLKAKGLVGAVIRITLCEINFLTLQSFRSQIFGKSHC